jgi:hypothetical protein
VNAIKIPTGTPASANMTTKIRLADMPLHPITKIVLIESHFVKRGPIIAAIT